MKDAIALRLAECGGLGLHPDKTRIVYCKTSGRHGRHERVSFDSGYTFKPRSAGRKDGTVFTTFASGDQRHGRQEYPAAAPPDAVSPAQRPELRRHRHDGQRESGPWAAYYGRFTPSEAARVLFHIDRTWCSGPDASTNTCAGRPAAQPESSPRSRRLGQGCSLTGDGNCERESRRPEPDDRAR